MFVLGVCILVPLSLIALPKKCGFQREQVLHSLSVFILLLSVVHHTPYPYIIERANDYTHVLGEK
jgi:hypothetical protein